MNRSTFLWMLSLAFFLVFLALQPLLTYAIFGSDTGEYYRLTMALVSTGHLPVGSAYAGWGTAYPDFPGIFLLAGLVGSAYGTDVLTALTVTIPVVAALSVLPLFLLFRRLYPNETIALLGAAFSSVAMPRLFSIAHPAPLAIGDLFVVGALWMFVESRRDIRWYLPLGLTAGALIVTHHLSSYFFVVSALGGLLLFELWRPGLWSRRFPSRELAFLAAFATATLAYWFYGTHAFVSKVIDSGLRGFHVPNAVGFPLFEAAAMGGVLLTGLLLRWRRGRPRNTSGWVRLPTDRSWARDAVLLAVGIFGAIAILLVVPIPGTTQRTDLITILWFSPLLGIGIFAAGSRRNLSTARLGAFPLMWTGAVSLSALLWLLVGSYFANNDLSQVVPASRHVEYLFIPIGLLVAAGAGRVVARAGDAAGRRAILVASVGVVVLLAANAAIVYPPPSDFGGFQEGLTVHDQALWMWIGIAVPVSSGIASDHRLSSMIFGFDGNRASWDVTPALFNGGPSDFSAAIAELRNTSYPASTGPVVYVAIDATMYEGVALNPSATAIPLSAAAIAWFQTLPFVPVYEDGQQVVYFVDAATFPP